MCAFCRYITGVGCAGDRAPMLPTALLQPAKVAPCRTRRVAHRQALEARSADQRKVGDLVRPKLTNSATQPRQQAPATASKPSPTWSGSRHRVPCVRELWVRPCRVASVANPRRRRSPLRRTVGGPRALDFPANGACQCPSGFSQPLPPQQLQVQPPRIPRLPRLQRRHPHLGRREQRAVDLVEVVLGGLEDVGEAAAVVA